LPTTAREAGTIVWVPYPHVERQQITRRPALVVSRAPLGPDGPLIWTLMITSAARPRWPGDVVIPDHEAAGLPIPSIIRTAKITTVAAASAERAGRVTDVVCGKVCRRFREIFFISR
jgi:mRNA interferase MazF